MLLALPDVTIIDKEELAGDIRIVVETANHPKTCQRCMDLTAKISRWVVGMDRPRNYGVSISTFLSLLDRGQI